jgi:hypothetical protein
MRYKLITAIGAIAIAIACGATAVFAQRPAASSAQAHGHGAADAAAHIALLRRARGANDDMNAADVSASPGAADTVDVKSARKANKERRLFVAPSTDGNAVCVLAPGETNCPLADDLVSEGAAPAVFWHADGLVHVTGVATDSVDSVEVVYSDGTVQRLAASDNVLDAQLRERPSVIRWDGPNGREEIRAPDESLVG